MIRNCFIKLQILILAAAGCLFTVSCSQIDVYEKHTVIPAYEWQNSFSATGDFLITDTVSAYSIYLVIRHTDAYQYNNIWLNIGLQPPGDSMYIQKVNLSLGDDANGWEGSGMNDIWELRKLLNGEPRRFKQAGKYQFTISHIMRDNPLLHVMSVGLRVEKIKN
ncbi:MAG TPA: gliding motility lipoprotein GldH [Ferruginibacter sp.]|nr:gliding motility lipoprotein GldH [Chitinophagaceae bacterium]MBK7557497.1 gliding motility lipoprotein GldH [Chitinophagaceae bacterium]HQW92238.1 gliding motility lipoprotein GldH [Ferruginibacter sp.]